MLKAAKEWKTAGAQKMDFKFGGAAAFAISVVETFSFACFG